MLCAQANRKHGVEIIGRFDLTLSWVRFSSSQHIYTITNITTTTASRVHTTIRSCPSNYPITPSHLSSHSTHRAHQYSTIQHHMYTHTPHYHSTLSILYLSQYRGHTRIGKHQVHCSVSLRVKHAVIAEYIIGAWILLQVEVLHCTIADHGSSGK